MPHVCTDLSPFAGHRTVGKLDEVKAVVDIRLQFVHGNMGRLIVPILILTGKSDAEDGQRLGTDILRELEELEEPQSIALVVVRIIAVVEGVLPAVTIQWTVLHRTYCILPLVACVEVSTLYDTAAGETEDARL